MKNTNRNIKQKKCKYCETLFYPFKTTQVVCNHHCAQLYAEEKRKKEEQKEWKERKKKLSIDAHSKEHKNTLQNEINKLARMIDAHCGYNVCVDCDRVLDKQIHGAHYHNVKGNENIRYNLLNIHSSRSECNKYDSEHKARYKVKISERYGEDFFNYLENELRLEYKEMHFSNKEIYNAIPIVRKLQRDLKTITNKDSLSIRKMFNNIIGLYKKH